MLCILLPFKIQSMNPKNYTKEDIANQINQLEYLLNEDASYYEIRKKIESFQWTIFSQFFRADGIVRVRFSDKLSTESMVEGKYEDIREIHHKKDENVEHFGRLNPPNESRFYAASTPVLALCEASENYRLGKLTKYETATSGYWDLQEKIMAAIIVNPNADYGKNEKFREFQETLKNKEGGEVYYELFEYLTEKFINPSSKEKDYYITSAFANYVFNTKWEHPEFNQIDCIIYPSGLPYDTYKEMNAMNLCFPARIVNKNLILKIVSSDRIETTKIGDQIYVKSISRVSAKDLDYENEKIIW